MREIGTGNVSVTIDGYRADVTLNRPDKRNAMNVDLLQDLKEALEEVEAEDDVRAITLLGEGPVFCAGMDLEMMTEGSDEVLEERRRLFRDVLTAIDESTSPVVVGIKGAGIAGAFELTLPADFRILGENAKFGVQEVKLGVFPAGGSITRLPRLIGLAKAKELVLTGELIDPEEADRCDLVTEVVPDDEVDERAREYADELTENAPLGLEQALKAFNHTTDVPFEDSLEIERYLSEEISDTRDRHEGFRARREGREPEFEGR
jgi:enoyl-CoA hydratase/carnithine racemase